MKIMQAYGKVVDSEYADGGPDALALGAVGPVVEAQSFHLGSCCAFAYHDARSLIASAFITAES